MERIEIYGKFCRSWEGGWDENQNSPDGPKMRGISLKTFKEYCKAKKLNEPTRTDLRNMTVSIWTDVMKWRVWDKIKADKIQDEWLAYLIADSVWMSGTDYIKEVQENVGAGADGIVGKETLGKINEKDPDKLFKKLWDKREAHFNALAQEPNNEKLLKGWLNRLNSISHGCLCNNGSDEEPEVKMSKIEKYGVFCRSWEGGWSDNPHDHGGATMKGVTIATYTNYRKAKGLPKPTKTDLRNITNTEWNEVLRWFFWDKIKADKINDEWVTYLLVDAVWMSGITYVKKVQSELGLTADGVIGQQTLAKINGMDGEKLFQKLWKQREKFLKNIAKNGHNKDFLKGWMNRLNSVHYGYLSCSNGTRIS
ncbi:MAG: hypothetical protein IJG42_08870 [Muribaculaceae bacterium]|nr:hypothetical protein [Muribaculaceae bacterium]